MFIYTQPLPRHTCASHACTASTRFRISGPATCHAMPCHVAPPQRDMFVSWLTRGAVAICEAHADGIYVGLGAHSHSAACADVGRVLMHGRGGRRDLGRGEEIYVVDCRACVSNIPEASYYTLSRYLTRYTMRSAQRSNSQNTLSGQTDGMFWPLFLSNLLLSALSIANLGLISSMVGFLHEQKDNVHSYEVAWPEGTVKLNVEPARLWTDQGHTSNGVAGYGFFLGLFGMYVAWRQRRQTNTKVYSFGACKKRKRRGQRKADLTQRISKSLTALLVLLFLAVLFTLSALIFVFVVTQRTRNQAISQAVAEVNQGIDYPALEWTPETWFKAVLDTPLEDRAQHDEIAAKVLSMTVWRWMLLPILVVDVAAWIVAALAVSKQRNGAVQPEFVLEK
jgi:hypothetical protein